MGTITVQILQPNMRKTAKMVDVATTVTSVRFMSLLTKYLIETTTMGARNQKNGMSNTETQ